MAALAQDLDENDVLLVKVTPENYGKELFEIIGAVGGRGTRTCVVLLSRPYESVAKKFGKDGKLFFICAGNVPEERGIRVESAGDLNELGIAFTTALKGGCDAALMESMSVLFFHAEYNSVMKFLFDSVKKVREGGAKMVFVSTTEDEHTKELYPFIDKIVTYA